MTEINDSELLKLEKVNNWAAARQKTYTDIDQFTKDLEEQVNLAGFTCEVKVYDTDQPDAYGFDVEITGRTLGSFFDPDRQVHEVTNNLLQLPGEDKGFIKSKEYLDKLVNREVKKSKGGHFKGHKH